MENVKTENDDGLIDLNDFQDENLFKTSTSENSLFSTCSNQLFEDVGGSESDFDLPAILENHSAIDFSLVTLPKTSPSSTLFGDSIAANSEQESYRLQDQDFGQDLEDGEITPTISNNRQNLTFMLDKFILDSPNTSPVKSPSPAPPQESKLSNVPLDISKDEKVPQRAREEETELKRSATVCLKRAPTRLKSPGKHLSAFRSKPILSQISPQKIQLTPVKHDLLASFETKIQSTAESSISDIKQEHEELKTRLERIRQRSHSVFIETSTFMVNEEERKQKEKEINAKEKQMEVPKKTKSSFKSSIPRLKSRIKQLF